MGPPDRRLASDQVPVSCREGGWIGRCVAGVGDYQFDEAEQMRVRSVAQSVGLDGRLEDVVVLNLFNVGAR